MVNKFRVLIKKYKALDLTVKAGLWFTICNVLQKGISIITVPIFTRLLTQEQYGTYSLYVSWLNIITVFTTMNLYLGVFNKAMVKYSTDRDQYISAVQGLSLSLCATYFLLYILCKDIVEPFLGLSSFLICMMFVEMAVTPALQFWSGRQRFEYQYKKLVAVTLLKSAMNPLLGIIAVWLSEYKVEARVAAIVFVELIICGPIMIKQFMKYKCFFHYEYWKYAFMFNLPLIPHYLSTMILNQGDRIIIQKLVSASAVALYSVAYNVGMLTQLITNAIAQAITPWLYQCLKKKEYADINKKLKNLMIVVLCVSFMLMMFAPEVVWLFASKEYASAVYVIPPVAASVFFIFVYTIYSNFEFYFEKRAFVAIASFVSAIVNIVLNYLLIPSYGYVAAGYTTLFCYVMYAHAHYLFSYYICRINSIENVFKYSDLVVLSLLVLAITALSSVLYSSILIRYGVLLLLAIIVGINFRKIRRIVLG